MKITPIHLYSHQVLGSGIHLVSGALEVGQAAGATETHDWPSRPPWASSQESVDTFAAIHHSIMRIRDEYPFLCAHIAQAPWYPNSIGLPHEVFGTFPNVQLDTRFVLSPDGGFHRFEGEGLDVYLFDIGTESPYDFGGLVEDAARFDVVFLFSKNRPALTEIKEIVERTADAESLRRELTSRFGVMFFPTEDADFVLLTMDQEIVHAFLASVRSGKTG